MAAADGGESAGLIEALRREPYRFDFFQAVRLLEHLGGRAPVGRDAAPDEEAVRFRALPALRFPAAEISRLSQTPDGPPEMVVSFLGLTGPSGVLPQHYTTLLLSRIRGKDYSLRDFLDLFNHRITSLFHRAWEKYRLPFSYERSRQDGKEEGADPITTCLYARAARPTVDRR